MEDSVHISISDVDVMYDCKNISFTLLYCPGAYIITVLRLGVLAHVTGIT